MDVTISLKIDLDATATLSHMEAMKAALTQATAHSEDQQKRGPMRAGGHVQTPGTRRRAWLTGFGRGDVPLRRVCCQQCRHLFHLACAATGSGRQVLAQRGCSSN